MVGSVFFGILTIVCAYLTVQVNRSYLDIDPDTLTFMDFFCPGSRVLGAANCDRTDAANCDLLSYLCGKNDAWWSDSSSIALVRLAIARGANPNAAAFGVSALTRALDCNNEELLRYLLRDCKLDPNQVIDRYGSTLIFAAKNIRMAEILIEEFKADPNIRNKYGKNVFHAICERVHSWLLIPWYCEHGFKPPYEAMRDWTPLHSLAKCIRQWNELGMHNAMLSLLEAGVDPEKREMERFKTARQLAQEGLECNLGGLLEEYKQKYRTFFAVLDIHKEKCEQVKTLAEQLKNASLKELKKEKP